jgi:hypothetical protein
LKHPKQMTDAELCALSDEETRLAVQRACAEEGVPLLDPAHVDKPPEPVLAEGDVFTYKVGDWLFCQLADAEAVAALVGSSPQWEVETRWAMKPPLRTVVKGKTAGLPEIVMDKIMSPEGAERYQSAAEHHAAMREAYDKRAETRKRGAERRIDMEREVRNLITAAKAREAHREAYASAIAEYIRLADGDLVVARRFFEKANPGVLTQFPDLETKLQPPSTLAVDLYCGCTDDDGQARLRSACATHAVRRDGNAFNAEEIPF